MEEPTEKKSYVKFGEDVAQHWTAPTPEPDQRPTSAALVRPYAPMYSAPQRLDLIPSKNVNQYHAAFTVEPIAGLRLMLHVAADTETVDENDLLNGLTELLHTIHSQRSQGRVRLDP